MSGLVAPVLAIIALCVAAVGVIAVQPVFWTMPTQLLSGTAPVSYTHLDVYKRQMLD